MRKSFSLSKGMAVLSLFVASCHQVTTPSVSVKQKTISKKIMPEANPIPKADTDAVALLQKTFPQYKNGKIEKIHDAKNHFLSISITGKDDASATLIGNTKNSKSKQLNSHDVTYALITDNHGSVTREFELTKHSDGFVIKKILTKNEIEDEKPNLLPAAKDYSNALYNCK